MKISSRRTLDMVLLALLAGCGEPRGSAGVNAAGSITGGLPSPGDPAVVALLLAPRSCEVDPEPESVRCTGTLVAPRAILTAAHCVSGLVPSDLSVYFGNDFPGDPGATQSVVWVRVHPDWQDRVHDIALLALAEPSGIRPVPLLEDMRTLDVDEAVRVVGFGADDSGEVGIKREGAARITRIEAETFSIAAAPAMTCTGDSGGPVFLATDDDEAVAGVTSGGDPGCHTGVNARVDIDVDGFLAEGLAEIEELPPARGPIDPSVDYCESGCDSDLDCPAGMNCMDRAAGGSSCALEGFAPGSFTGPCASSVECTGGFCAEAAGCRCYRPCDAPTGGGGCSTSGRGRGDRGEGAFTIALVLTLGWFGRRRSARQASSGRAWSGGAALFACALFFAGCDSSGCPAGTRATGSVGTETACLLPDSDVRHGPYVEWWKDSKPPQRKRAGNYAHGALDGVWTAWYATGELERVVEYRDGKMQGRSVSYHPNGRKREEGEARDGVRIGTWTSWRDDGTRERSVEYLRDSREQRWTNYGTNEKPAQTGTFIDGYKEGRFVEYHDNGLKAMEGDYRRSKKDGVWVFRDEGGKESRRETWKDGVLEGDGPVGGEASAPAPR